MLKFQIVLPYLDAPNLLRNALESIRDLEYQDWFLGFWDDGSRIPGRPIVEDVLRDHLAKVTCYRVEDTPDQKRANGGSRHGEGMNRIIVENEQTGAEDVVVILCQDDHLFPDYFTNLNKYYSEHPNVVYSYCHIADYNPMVEKPSPELRERGCGYNHTHDLFACGVVDSSQVTYRKRAFLEGLRYPSPATVALDASMFSLLGNKYGPAPWNGCKGQLKGWGPFQLGARSDPFNPIDIS